ncbi:MAG: holo-ACP synthase [Elusimicrobia bacterium]|nr:holo-ACP synthase [Candidatus Obscuribacterium magneticum]MCB4755862.1 holo-ACP synthase [Candidatus Obscuribacterium magneticum]
MKEKISLGIDIEEVDRFKKLIRNPRFLHRVFTEEEIAYCRSKADPAQHFAVRFSAKEAVWKALSDVLGRRKKEVSHRDIGIRNLANGKPRVTLPRSLAPLSPKISISLSHSKSTAVAVAVYKGTL